MKNIILFLGATLLCFSSFRAIKRKPTIEAVHHSFSNYEQVPVRHLDWKAKVDFKNKLIRATATWSFSNPQMYKQIIFDVNALSIDSVTNGKSRIAYELTKQDDLLGSALIINIVPSDKQVKIFYNTTAEGNALQWLTPAQTADKKKEFLFTQCQAIMARSIIPCMDIPALRFTYNARVEVPKGMMALMSADNPKTKNASGVYNFVMNKPIPSYLFALAVGDIAYKAYDNRCGVYAEPGVLQKAAKELNDMPTLIKSAEKLAGPYSWGRYDVLILPPSFPFGGMENPKLTFATPTILAGDKSLVSLIAHELAHSWSGNTVTNANWDELWINEGFTTYLERRIMESISDKDYTDMVWELSYQDLLLDAHDYGMEHEFTKLKIDLANQDPDESFSSVPYDKGAHFLWLLEQSVGRKQFDQFMFKYFKDNAFKPMTTELLVNYMDKNLFNNFPGLKDKIQFNDWLYKPGVPANIPRPARVKFDAIDKLMLKLNDNYSNADGVMKSAVAKWSTNEYLYFLRKITDNVTTTQMNNLDAIFNFTKAGNKEIAFQWFYMAIKHKYSNAYPAVEQFLKSVGRTKFVRPLYREMINGDSEMQKRAARIFQEAKNSYHPATEKRVADLFKKE